MRSLVIPLHGRLHALITWRHCMHTVRDQGFAIGVAHLLSSKLHCDSTSEANRNGGVKHRVKQGWFQRRRKAAK